MLDECFMLQDVDHLQRFPEWTDVFIIAIKKLIILTYSPERYQSDTCIMKNDKRKLLKSLFSVIVPFKFLQ